MDPLPTRYPTKSSKTPNLIYHRVYSAPPPRSELAPSQLTDDGLPVLILPPAPPKKPTKLRKRARKQEAVETMSTSALDGPSSPISIMPPFPFPAASPKKKKLRLVCISDTHLHTPYLPRGDVLIHAGDLTNLGTKSELSHSISWLLKQPHTHKLIIAGNHDVTLDPQQSQYDPENLSLLTEAPGLIYLNHSSTTICGLKVFGSPFSPGDGRWAFQYSSGEDAEPWAEIPDDTELLITHTPPRYHLDRAPALLPPEPHKGCESLRQRISKVRPRMHVFGHVHAGRGVEKVRWAGLGVGRVDFREESVTVIEDPNPEQPRKQFLVDARGVERGRETLLVNAAIARGSWKHGVGREGGWGKAVVVDIDVEVDGDGDGGGGGGGG
jgi:Icc-related predicted phosphoesterase